MGRTTALRSEIKKTFVPHVTDKGFACDMRGAPGFFTFRKITPDAVFVFDIQWEKRGRPRFVVNFGKCAPLGVVVRGQPVLPGDLEPYNSPSQGRLRPGAREWTTRAWFCQDRRLVSSIILRSTLRAPSEVVSELIALFAELEEFWSEGRIGKHIHLTPPMPPALRGEDIVARGRSACS
jgi:hypothetical protein